jgi:hypothetical protein
MASGTPAIGLDLATEAAASPVDPSCKSRLSVAEWGAEHPID